MCALEKKIFRAEKRRRDKNKTLECFAFQHQISPQKKKPFYSPPHSFPKKVGIPEKDPLLQFFFFVTLATVLFLPSFLPLLELRRVLCKCLLPHSHRLPSFFCFAFIQTPFPAPAISPSFSPSVLNTLLLFQKIRESHLK